MSVAGADPRLLVVTLDRLPAWMLPAAGSTWVAMPAVDALAGRGLTLDGVLTTADDAAATLAAMGMPEAGDDTIVVTDAAAVAALAAAAGMTVRLVEAVPRSAPVTDAAMTNTARLCAAAGEALTVGRHATVWCHAAGLGLAWDAPASFREAYTDPEDPPPYAGAAVPEFHVDADTDPDLLVGIRQAFAGQLTHLDSCLGPLFAAARDRHVLLVGVRGIGLGLHGRVGTGPMPPYGELVHVPAILADVSGRMAAQRFGGLVVPADLGATLCELRGRPTPGWSDAAPWQGRSLAGLLSDWSAPPRDRVVVVAAHGAAVVTAGWHLLAEPHGSPRLFHKPDDYFELCDVADRCPQVVEELGPLAAAAAAGDVGPAWLTALSAAARGAD